MSDQAAPTSYGDDIEAKDQYGRSLLTLGQLRSIIETLPDEVHVTVDDGNDWFANVASVGVGSELTFRRGGMIDSRQF